MGVLPEALSWVKGACSASALRGCCRVLLLQLLVQSCEGSSLWATWDVLSVLPQLPPTPNGPMTREGWPKCHHPPSMLHPRPGGHSTEPAQHGQSRGLYCPQLQVYAGGWISHLWPDLCGPEGSVCRRRRAAAPTPSGSLLCAPQRPPCHQHHLLLLSRSLIQLFPQYGLWSQMIPTWQLSWRGWWKSGKEIHW